MDDECAVRTVAGEWGVGWERDSKESSCCSSYLLSESRSLMEVKEEEEARKRAELTRRNTANNASLASLFREHLAADARKAGMSLVHAGKAVDKPPKKVSFGSIVTTVYDPEPEFVIAEEEGDADSDDDSQPSLTVAMRGVTVVREEFSEEHSDIWANVAIERKSGTRTLRGVGKVNSAQCAAPHQNSGDSVAMRGSTLGEKYSKGKKSRSDLKWSSLGLSTAMPFGRAKKFARTRSFEADAGDVFGERSAPQPLSSGWKKLFESVSSAMRWR